MLMENKNKLFSTLSTILPLVLAVGFLVFSRTVIQPVRVVGDSMYPTYHDKQFLFADRLDENFERFDVVVLKSSNKYLIIKRIIGLPGDTVEVTPEGVKINDEFIDDVVDIKIEDIGKYNKVTLKDNEYYVMGDNRNNSSDSRVYGVFSKDDIIGKIQNKK